MFLKLSSMNKKGFPQVHCSGAALGSTLIVLLGLATFVSSNSHPAFSNLIHHKPNSNININNGNYFSSSGGGGAGGEGEAYFVGGAEDEGGLVSGGGGGSLSMCLSNYEVSEGSIIRTRDSQELGAKFLNESDLGAGGHDECLRLCCRTPRCNVAVFQEKVKN
jgi:hypothetical protein